MEGVNGIFSVKTLLLHCIPSSTAYYR